MPYNNMNHLNVRNLSGLSNGYFDSLDVAGNIIQYGGTFNTNEDISGYTILGQPSSYFTGLTSNIQNQFYSIENQILLLNSISLSSTISGSNSGSNSGSISGLIATMNVTNSIASLSNNTITSNLSLIKNTNGITFNLSSPFITRALLQTIIGISDADMALFATVGGLGAAIIANAILTGLAFATIQAELFYLDTVAGRVINMFDNMATNAIGIAQGLITYPIGEAATTFIKGSFKVGASFNSTPCLFMVDHVSSSTNAYGELKANTSFYVHETSHMVGNVSMDSNLTVTTSMTCPIYYAPFTMKDVEENYSIKMTSAQGISLSYSKLDDPNNYHSFIINSTGMSASTMTLYETTTITGNLKHTFNTASLCNLESFSTYPTGFFFSNEGTRSEYQVQLNMIGTINNSYSNIYDAGIMAMADIPNGNNPYQGFLKLKANTLFHEGRRANLCNFGTTESPNGFLLRHKTVNTSAGLANTIQLHMISKVDNIHPDTFETGIWSAVNASNNGIVNGYQYLGNLYLKANLLIHTGQFAYLSMLNNGVLGVNDTITDIGKSYILTRNNNVNDVTNTVDLSFKANPTTVYDSDCSIVVVGGGNNSVVTPQLNSGFMTIKAGSVNLAQCSPSNQYPTYIGAWNNNIGNNSNKVVLKFKANPTLNYDSDVSIWAGLGVDQAYGGLDIGALEIKCGKLLLGQSATNIQIGTSVSALSGGQINIGNVNTTTYFSGQVEFSGVVIMPSHLVVDPIINGFNTFINVAGRFRQF